MNGILSRRNFLVASAALTASLLPAYGQQSKGKGRVIILGFDGVEPRIIDKMLKNGDLPNLSKLASAGSYSRLRTTIPPQSPAAWNSFSTCKNPGGHGIYDFIRRDTATHLPGLGTSKTIHPSRKADGSVSGKARAIGFRKGDPFWTIADRAGVRCKVFNLPFAYPPDNLKNGKMLSGLDTPSLSGNQNSFSAFSDSYTARQLAERVSGGERYSLDFKDGKARVEVNGAYIPKASSREKTAYEKLALDFQADRSAKTLSISGQSNSIVLKEGQWSGWLEWTFEPAKDFKVSAISRFYLMEAGEKVRLYMSALQYHPGAPYVQFSCPASYSEELASRHGLYKTLGWAHETHALRATEITEEGFIEDALRTMDWRAMLTLDELERDDFDILISAWTATDRIAHMYWRYMDPEHPLYTEEGAAKYGDTLERSYRKMDEIVGKIFPEIRENDLFMVMSDHGFETSRKGFNLNTWLVRNGYAVLKGQTDAATAFGQKGFMLDFDWSKTKAYAVGLSSMYLNIQGREKKGIVPSSESDALIQELRAKLLAVTDPDNGAKVFDEIYTRDIYSGECKRDAPDIVMGYAKGYQNTKSTAKGAIPKELFDVNDDKWSGDHVASDAARVPGMLFTNKPLARTEPDIKDLGVSALAYSGTAIPPDLEGKSLV